MAPSETWRFHLAAAEATDLAATATAVVLGAAEAFVLVPAIAGAGAWFGCKASGTVRRPLAGVLAGLAAAILLYSVLLGRAISAVPEKFGDG